MTERRTAAGRRRAPHPARNARIAAAGFGTAATLGLVTAMAVAAGDDATTALTATDGEVSVQQAPSTTSIPMTTVEEEDDDDDDVTYLPSAPTDAPAASTGGSR